MSFDDFGRFSDPALLILISLAEKAKHGYAMMEDIKMMADIELGPGTLYGALGRLEKQGWITPLPAEERRRPYRLTSTGQIALQKRLASLEAIATQGKARLSTL